MDCVNCGDSTKKWSKRHTLCKIVVIYEFYLRSKKGALGSFLNFMKSEIKPLGLLLLLQQALRMQLGRKQRYLQGSYDRFLQKSF